VTVPDLVELETSGSRRLCTFDFLVVKLKNLAAVEADDVIVMPVLIELVNDIALVIDERLFE